MFEYLSKYPLLQRNLVGRETSAAGNDEKRKQESTSHVLGYVKSWPVKVSILH